MRIISPYTGLWSASLHSFTIMFDHLPYCLAEPDPAGFHQILLRTLVPEVDFWNANRYGANVIVTEAVVALPDPVIWIL